jgi:hypothetical protein
LAPQPRHLVRLGSAAGVVRGFAACNVQLNLLTSLLHDSYPHRWRTPRCCPSTCKDSSHGNTLGCCMHVGTASSHKNVSLIRYQSSNPFHTSVVPPTIPQPIRPSVHKWRISNGSAAARSVRPGAVSDDILSLGMSAFQERRKRGAQAAAIC